MEPSAVVAAVPPTSAQHVSMHPASSPVAPQVQPPPPSSPSVMPPDAPPPPAHRGMNTVNNNNNGNGNGHGNINGMEDVAAAAARSTATSMGPSAIGATNTNSNSNSNAHAENMSMATADVAAHKNAAGGHLVGSTNPPHDLPAVLTVPGGDVPMAMSMAMTMPTMSAPMPVNVNVNMNMNMNGNNTNNMDAPEKEKKGRRLQYVSTLRDRYEVIMWMREQERQRVKNVPLRAIDVFPQFFQATHPANRMKAQRWWQQRHREDLNELMKVDVVSGRPRTKARAGRGRKSPPWVIALLGELEEAGELNISANLLDTKNVRTVASRILGEKPQKYPHCDNKTLARIVRKFLKTRGADENGNAIAIPTIPAPNMRAIPTIPVSAPPPPSTSATVPPIPSITPVHAENAAPPGMGPQVNEPPPVEGLHGLPPITPVTLTDPLQQPAHHTIPSMPSAHGSNGNGNENGNGGCSDMNESGAIAQTGLPAADEIPMDTGQGKTESEAVAHPSARAGSE